jgi:hypothetical protein
MWRDRDIHTKKASALAAGLKSFPRPFPFFNVGIRVHVWKISQRSNPPPTVCTSIEHLCFECEPPR